MEFTIATARTIRLCRPGGFLLANSSIYASAMQQCYSPWWIRDHETKTTVCTLYFVPDLKKTTFLLDSSSLFAILDVYYLTKSGFSPRNRMAKLYVRDILVLRTGAVCSYKYKYMQLWQGSKGPQKLMNLYARNSWSVCKPKRRTAQLGHV